MELIKEISHRFFNEEQDIQIQEIGTGNLNYVYRLRGKEKSYIVKMALDRARISEQMVIPKTRVLSEALYVNTQKTNIGEYLPEFYEVDGNRGYIVMEDLNHYECLRDELLQYKTFDFLGKQLVDALIHTLLPTSKALMKRELRETRGKELGSNALNEVITRPLLFDEPYTNCNHRNVVTDENVEFVRKILYEDEELKEIVKQYEFKFFHEDQALLHGDLHTGSIFVTNQALKLLDFEFTLWGPMGFDLGNLLANLVFSYIHGSVSSNQKLFCDWLLDTIVFLFDEFKKESLEILEQKHVADQIDMDCVMMETVGFMGIELIRRTVGLAGVLDIRGIEPKTMRSQVERKVILLGKELLLNSASLVHGNALRKVISKYFE